MKEPEPLNQYMWKYGLQAASLLLMSGNIKGLVKQKCRCVGETGGRTGVLAQTGKACETLLRTSDLTLHLGLMTSLPKYEV